MRHRRKRALPVAVLTLALAALGFAGPAQAKLVKEFTKFQYCPWTNTEVKKCIWANTESGEVKLGSKTVTIEHPVLLQGGFGKANAETKVSKFFGTTGGKPILAPVSQNVPGGLAGIVPDKSSPTLVKKLIKFFFENSLTGLGATLELAGTASNVEISENHLSRAEGVALHLPVKVHLENPFLGSKCYVGSDSSPMIWNLTSGVTEPPKGFTPIEGKSGEIEFIEEGLMLKLNGNSLVENNWSAPKASGCGGLLAFLVNPIVNGAAGLPASAGTNVAILNNTVNTATTAAIELINSENP